MSIDGELTTVPQPTLGESPNMCYLFCAAWHAGEFERPFLRSLSVVFAGFRCVLGQQTPAKGRDFQINAQCDWSMAAEEGVRLVTDDAIDASLVHDVSRVSVICDFGRHFVYP